MCFIVDHSTTVIQHSNNNEYMSERELTSYLKSFFFFINFIHASIYYNEYKCKRSLQAILNTKIQGKKIKVFSREPQSARRHETSFSLTVTLSGSSWTSIRICRSLDRGEFLTFFLFREFRVKTFISTC